jgi:hypothetical protein
VTLYVGDQVKTLFDIRIADVVEKIQRQPPRWQLAFSIHAIQIFCFDIDWTVIEAGVKYTMTTKRTTKADGLSAGSSVNRPRRASATHSRKPSSATTTTSATAVIDQEAIAALAYSYWEARGCQGGSPDEDWLRAEQELLSR